MRFDYYAASLPASVSHCINSILSSFPGKFSTDNPVRPYKTGLRHSSGGFRLYHGGQNPLPFFVCSGADAVAGSNFVRTLYPSHRVSRVDVAHDFAHPGGFDHVARLLDPIARAAGVAVTFIGDPDPSQRAGRTIYYGSPKSDVRICLYEKGLHELSKGSKTAAEDWFRLELRVRPRKERKALTARLSGPEMWGLASWTVKAAEQVLNIVPAYLPDPTLRQSDTDKAVSHMLLQYARALRSFVEQHGRDELNARISQAISDDA